MAKMRNREGQFISTHGESNHRNGKLTKEYRAWRGMLRRCYYTRDDSYPRYGGRGISVCPSWECDYAKFLSDMGRSPIGYSLDRINPDGNYEPSNCRWATAKEQSINQTRKNTCKYGHPFDYIDPHGDRSCRTCKRARDERYRATR